MRDEPYRIGRSFSVLSPDPPPEEPVMDESLPLTRGELRIIQSLLTRAYANAPQRRWTSAERRLGNKINREIQRRALVRRKGRAA